MIQLFNEFSKNNIYNPKSIQFINKKVSTENIINKRQWTKLEPFY